MTTSNITTNASPATTGQTEIIITAKARVFTGFGTQTLKFLVTKDDVKPFDKIAGHFTTCHRMSPATKRRIRKLAGI